MGVALLVASDAEDGSVGLEAGELETVASASPSPSPSLLEEAPGAELKSDVRGLSDVH